MGCCIALALLISVVRTGWFRLVRRQAPPRVGFAPPARRPAPGAPALTTPAGTRVPGSQRIISAPRRRHLATAVVVGLSAVIGAGLYSELLAVLVHSGLVTVTGDLAGWRVRELVLIGGSVAAVLVAAAMGLHRPAAVRRRRQVALALTGAGTAWSLLSVVDMHLTALIPETLVDPLTDLALHGPGFLAATTGLGALLAGDRWMNSLSPSTTRGTS